MATFADAIVREATLWRAGQGGEAMGREDFASVRNAISDTPAEAETMKLRSALMIALKDRVACEGLTPSAALDSGFACGAPE